jgi:hypothetical protein
LPFEHVSGFIDDANMDETKQRYRDWNELTQADKKDVTAYIEGLATSGTRSAETLANAVLGKFRVKNAPIVDILRRQRKPDSHTPESAKPWQEFKRELEEIAQAEQPRREEEQQQYPEDDDPEDLGRGRGIRI